MAKLSGACQTPVLGVESGGLGTVTNNVNVINKEAQRKALSAGRENGPLEVRGHLATSLLVPEGPGRASVGLLGIGG